MSRVTYGSVPCTFGAEMPEGVPEELQNLPFRIVLSSDEFARLEISTPEGLRAFVLKVEAAQFAATLELQINA